MASFFAFGIDVINNPAVGTNSSAGQDGAGQMTLSGGSQPFADDAIIEFITQNETADGELDGGSSFIGIKVYASAADYNAGIVQYNYVPMNPGQSANIQSDVSGLGDTYVRFNANVLVPRTESGANDPSAPTFGNLLVAPGTNAGDNIGTLKIDRNTDQDFDGDGSIASGTLEDGNGKFYVGNTVPCFTAGSLIATAKGETPVEHLKAGDAVITRDHGMQKVSWVGARQLTAAELVVYPHLRPVLITAGALGAGGGGVPHRRLAGPGLAGRRAERPARFAGVSVRCGLREPGGNVGVPEGIRHPGRPLGAGTAGTGRLSRSPDGTGRGDRRCHP